MSIFLPGTKQKKSLKGKTTSIQKTGIAMQKISKKRGAGGVHA